MTRVIEADETGRLALPDEVLQEIRPHTKYIVEARGDGLVIYPQTPILTDKPAKPTLEQWEAQWQKVQEMVGQSWNTDKSAAEIIAEMRR